MLGHFDTEELVPMYTRVFEKYKAANPESVMFFEPGQFPDTYPYGRYGMVNKLGFETPPGGQVGSPNHVLNDHTYCCGLELDICRETGEP